VKTARLRLAGKIVFAAAYVLVAGEFFMRIFAPQAMLPRYVCATDYGIRGNEPNRSYWHTTPDYRVNIRTNAKGIRAHGEIPYEKPEGVKRIVLLGDSFGMGYSAIRSGWAMVWIWKIRSQAEWWHRWRTWA